MGHTWPGWPHGGCNLGPCQACRTTCPPATGRPRAAVRGEAPPQRQAFLCVGRGIPNNVPPETALIIHQQISSLPTSSHPVRCSRVCCSAPGRVSGILKEEQMDPFAQSEILSSSSPPPPPWRHLSTFPGGKKASRMEGTPSGVIRGQTRPGLCKAQSCSQKSRPRPMPWSLNPLFLLEVLRFKPYI